MPVKAPVTQLATFALLAGLVGALVGAIVVHTTDAEPPRLPPEHPLFGR